MNEGVKLLLERLKTHPEEFMKGGRWVPLVAEYKEYIPDELEPLINEARKLIAEEFTKDVMKELLHADDQDNDKWVDEILNRKLSSFTATVNTNYGKLKYDSFEESSGDRGLYRATSREVPPKS